MDTQGTQIIDTYFLLTPRFDIFALTSLTEVLRQANDVIGEPFYNIHMLSLDGPVATAHQQMQVRCTHPPTVLPRKARLFVPGGPTAQNYANPETLSWLRTQNRQGVEITAIGTGVHLLARSGILSGKRVTTHWPQLAGLAEQFPQLTTCDQIACTDGGVTTCAGGTAMIDVMLHCIGKDMGDTVADRIAHLLNHAPIRPLDTSQKELHAPAAFQVRKEVRVAAALIEENIAAPLSVPDIARHVGLSQRQLERQFTRDLGCTVVQYGLRTRLDHARQLIQTTSLSIREISIASGFTGLPHFSTAFSKRFGTSPAGYRSAFHKAATG